MRGLLAFLVMAIAGVSPAWAGTPAQLDAKRWGELPVQSGGRHKPLDTLSWETFRLIANRTSFPDPATGERLNATALYLVMLLDWQGWNHPDRTQLLLVADWRPLYFSLHQPDKWDLAPLLRIDYLELRAKLGLETDQSYVAAAALSKAMIEDPRSKKKLRFSAWAEQLLRLEEDNHVLSNLERKGLELAHRFWSYQSHRMGREMEIVPLKDGKANAWMSIAHVLLTPFDDANDPEGKYRQIQALLQKTWTAYHVGDSATINQCADDLIAVLAAIGPELGDYPLESQIQLEVAYNHWAPFRFAWIFMLLSVLGMLLHQGSRWKGFFFASWGSFGLGMIAMLIGFAMRIAIAGRPPVTNMYESVIYVGFGVAVFGLILELIYRKKFILTAGAAVSTVALILADNCPTILDPSLRPLEPVLRSNFWLVTHVMTITLSYAAFALAMGIANITLGYFLVGSTNVSAISALNRFTYKALQIGVLLLAAGTILGGVWADYSWGRFWGWDPKEVWALVALLGYLCVLHSRHTGWVGQRGLAALSVICFALVVMAWYGVNFVLGAGLHSYGFGGGGKGWVYTAVVVELLYAGAALFRSRPSAPSSSRSEQTLLAPLQECAG